MPMRHYVIKNRVVLPEAPITLGNYIVKLTFLLLLGLLVLHHDKNKAKQ